MSQATIITSPSAQVAIVVEGAAPIIGQAAAEVVIVVETPGTQGPQGLPGQPVRIDASLAATWILPHALGRVPAVQVFLASGEAVLADVAASSSTITVTHAQALQGFVLAF